MKSALITGIHGFAGSYLCRNLLHQGFRVLGIDRNESPAMQGIDWPRDQLDVLCTDLNDTDRIRSFLENRLNNQPIDYIFHLAGSAFVPASWKSPASVLQNNTLATIKLIEIARDAGWQGRFLVVSSSDVYGSQPASAMPLTENASTAPESPYAGSKLAAEKFALYYNKDGIDVIIARPFNHIGPGQNELFAVPAFMQRIRKALQSGQKSMDVGDLESTRDFTDVRDVVEGYRVILEKGAAGAVYNVCSGRHWTIRSILEMIFDAAGCRLELQVKSDLLRNEGTTVRYGSSDKLQALGWHTAHSLESAIQDMWDYIGQTRV
ncbi:MAG: GDP-mannose 4,6-dehydratase [Leptospiraceae bacterium]|nr:GDP-mannose 4,6-dehydratase [Leptospiraceae bacterium]